MTPQEDFNRFLNATGALRALRLSDARPHSATSWDDSIACGVRTEAPFMHAPSSHGLDASVSGAKRRASNDARVAALRPDPINDGKVAVLQEQVREMATQLAKVTKQLAQLLAKQAPTQLDEDEADAPIDSHFEWIETHRDELRAYPNAYVLLDTKKGIVFHSTNGEELTARLEGLAPEEQERLMVFHTSMAP